MGYLIIGLKLFLKCDLFLDCPLYKNIRPHLINCISTYFHVSLNIILFGNKALTDSDNEKIFLAVHKYIEKSNRFDSPNNFQLSLKIYYAYF